MKEVPSSSKKAFNPNDSSTGSTIRANIEKYAYYWKGFIFSLIVCLSAAFIYLRYTPEIYTIRAKILLQDDNQASGEMAGLAELSNLTGMYGGSAFVADQMDIMKSRRILRKVIKEHHLNLKYEVLGKIKTTEVMGDDSPLRLVLLEEEKNRALDSLNYSFVATILDKNTVQITDEQGLDKKVELGEKYKSPLGNIVLTPHRNLSAYTNQQLKISYRPVDRMIGSLASAILLTPNQDKQTYIVNFSMNSALIEKAELILNSLIEKYNEDISRDKSQVIQATTDFINTRLEIVRKDVDSADRNVALFKGGHHVVDMREEVGLYLKSASEIENKLLEAQTQVQIAEMMRSTVKTEDFQLLPSNMGLQDVSIENTIKLYNSMLLERDDILKSATPDNPVVQNLNKNLDELSRSLTLSLDNYNKGLSMQVQSLERQLTDYKAKLSTLPGQEQDFKPIIRQQQIVESLYLFLLEKREEAEIKKAAAPANLKIIDKAYRSDVPIAPKRKLITLIALLLGFLIPFGTLYIIFNLDNKIRSRKDIEEAVGVPVVGEVPKSEVSIVQKFDRSALAESFRILHTNIDFMLGTDYENRSQVLYVTSTIAGEGKTFISTNLAKILAMSDKRVLLIGADIRHPKTLTYLNIENEYADKPGVTQFLSNVNIAPEDLLIKTPADFRFDVLASGRLAPNPAELLKNGRFADLIKFGRSHYDFVVVDTAPVSLVADTFLIANHADLTLYVARAGFLETKLLNIPRDLYESDRLQNMAVLLNDVDFAKGYGYGYGYGYGSDAKKNSIIKKIKKILGMG